MKAEIIQFKKKAEKYKTELVEKETKLIVSMMDMDELKNQNSDYKRQINTQSMADLGGKHSVKKRGLKTLYSLSSSVHPQISFPEKPPLQTYNFLTD